MQRLPPNYPPDSPVGLAWRVRDLELRVSTIEASRPPSQHLQLPRLSIPHMPAGISLKSVALVVLFLLGLMGHLTPEEVKLIVYKLAGIS